ncbi:MAG: glutamate racemase [Acidimicrobiales bacterium]|nr:MAG: glutamate racemase [Acidimicrobiales bacterium]
MAAGAGDELPPDNPGSSGASDWFDRRPIGVFDSGFGGLTVARALRDLLPGEDFLYLADSARYPYGPRPTEEVVAFAQQIAKFLVAEGDVKLLVVACNTATAWALDRVRATVDVPVVGVVEPGVRALARATRSGRVGVIGTVGTVASGAYQRAVARLAPHLDLVCAACPGFVEFVERGETDGDQVRVLAERLLRPVREARVDALALGCTHYPFLARVISDAVGRDVVLVSSADETAFEVRSMLEQRREVAPADRSGGTVRYLASGDPGWFREVGARLMGEEITEVTRVVWQ